MKPEQDVIRWVVHTALGRRPPRPPAPDRWAAAIGELEASRLGPLAAHLLGPDLDALPLATRLELRATTERSRAMVGRTTAQLVELAPLLDRADLSWVVLKGVPLGRRLYPTPVCRPARDVDLLVADGDLERAGRILRDLGYLASGRFDRSMAHGQYRRRRDQEWEDLVELHWSATIPDFGGSSTEAMLGGRTRTDLDGFTVWVPTPEAERDLLLRHFVKHSSAYGILLLDLLLILRGEPYSHPLGQVVGDDLLRLGLGKTITGPSSLRFYPLRRWLTSRTFADRGRNRLPALVMVPLAMAEPGTLLSWMWRQVLWPRYPSERWQPVAATRLGRYTWRLRRLLRWRVP